MINSVLSLTLHALILRTCFACCVRGHRAHQPAPTSSHSYSTCFSSETTSTLDHSTSSWWTSVCLRLSFTGVEWTLTSTTQEGLQSTLMTY